MKVLLAVALFAFVALQSSLAAPRPDDEKKVDPVVPGALVADAAGANSAAAAVAAPTEVKPVEAAVEAVSSKAPAVSTSVATDEKKS